MQITPAPLSASTYGNRGLLMTGEKKKKKEKSQPPNRRSSSSADPPRSPTKLRSSPLISSHFISSPSRHAPPAGAGRRQLCAGGQRGRGCRGCPQPVGPWHPTAMQKGSLGGPAAGRAQRPLHPARNPEPSAAPRDAAR